MDEAMAAIADGSRVYISPICSIPTALVQAMADQRDRWTAIDLVTDYLVEPLPVFDHPNDPFTLTSLQPSRAVEKMRAAGALRSVPASYNQYLGFIGPGGRFAADVALIQVSPPGPEGRFSLGVGGGSSAELARTVPLLIAEVNPNMPYTFGAGELERSDIDLLVEVEHPVTELVVPEPDAIAQQIGALAAAEIEDGAVLQFGIGAIPESVLGELTARRDMGIHGGMIGDTVIDLYEAGALSGSRKSTYPGKMVVAGVLGTRKSFDWVDRNDEVLTVGSQFSHGPIALALLDRFTAINSALQISLDGSVNAEMAGTRVLSGPGGQPDFAVGAAASAGGLSIIAFPSTAARGTQSRVVPTLPPEVSTTLPRYLVDRVVTEYGVARLKGLPLEERADALRAIAHPDFRDQLG